MSRPSDAGDDGLLCWCERKIRKYQAERDTARALIEQLTREKASAHADLLRERARVEQLTQELNESRQVREAIYPSSMMMAKLEALTVERDEALSNLAAKDRAYRGAVLEGKGLERERDDAHIALRCERATADETARQRDEAREQRDAGLGEIRRMRAVIRQAIDTFDEEPTIPQLEKALEGGR